MIIMYIYHALINALSAHMIQIGLNKILFTHRNHKLNKQVQETEEKKQYAYLSVTYIQNDNHTDTYDSKMANYC